MKRCKLRSRNEFASACESTVGCMRAIQFSTSATYFDKAPSRAGEPASPRPTYAFETRSISPMNGAIAVHKARSAAAVSAVGADVDVGGTELACDEMGRLTAMRAITSAVIATSNAVTAPTVASLLPFVAGAVGYATGPAGPDGGVAWKFGACAPY